MKDYFCVFGRFLSFFRNFNVLYMLVLLINLDRVIWLGVLSTELKAGAMGVKLQHFELHT